MARSSLRTFKRDQLEVARVEFITNIVFESTAGKASTGKSTKVEPYGQLRTGPSLGLEFRVPAQALSAQLLCLAFPRVLFYWFGASEHV
jgi:hypothetical protein